MTTPLHPLTAPDAPGPEPRSHPSHHVVRCLRIEGEFDSATARAAVPPDAPPVDFAELRVPAEKAVELAAQEAAAPFAPASGPLLRIRVLRFADRACLLLAVAHRSLLDPGGLDAFLADHARAYSAARRGGPAAPAAQQQSDRPERSERPERSDRPEPTSGPSAAQAAADLAYWRARPPLPVLDLLTDLPRRPRSDRGGAVEHFVLPPDLISGLRELSVNPDDPVTPHDPDGSAAVYAAAAVFLARHTGQWEVPLLVPVRPAPAGPGGAARPETEVVLTPRLDDDPTFRELTARTAAELARARAHASALPPGALARLTGDSGDPDRQAVPVTFAVRSRPARPPQYGQTVCTPVALHLGTAARDLSFALDLRGDALHGTLEYDTDLFAPVTAQRLVRRLEELLTAAARRPDTRVTALPVLPSEERELVVTAWNRTAREFPRDRTTASFFEEQVRRDPSAIAVEHEDATLTYGELNTRANHLAHRLIGLGVVPDQPVGLCLPPSLDMVVCLLGILKAGGAYLPLDPDYPAERLRHVVDDAAARVVLTDAEHAPPFAGTAARVLLRDAPEPPNGTPAPPGTDPEVPATAEHLAYVLYTSGSTGAPKGVAVTHRALARLVKGADYVELGPDEAHLQLSPLSFDASLIELWGALLNGGRLVLPPSGLPFPDRLEAALRRHRITTLLLVSPQLHVAAERFPQELARVRQLLVGGDVLSPASAAQLLPHLDDTRFLHVYGPTECTLFATWKSIEAVDTNRPTIPIGRPIANTRTYVLDEDLNPVPTGVPGHLWLGGDGLAREYLGRPELTRERFLPDPFGPPDSRIYRTGDLARWLPDGDLEFLGRSDDQVKVRGYRIELGEVDAALAAHPDVRSVATVVRDDAPGGQALAAYLVGDRHLDDRELRAHLASRLPAFMVPAAFVRLDAIPLTPNGKVDRKALPAPEFGAGDAPQEGPRTELEAQVLGTIAEVLGLRAVGADEDFFDLGGNSLLLVDLFTRLQSRVPDSGLTLVDLLENRTGAGIAALVELSRGGA
ncbi:amino acid adenylation domain-containing protein [Streptomyces sp. WAC06614]|uniref:non-ribosomal peptide synthetase n=1 Tax=Streptomyces sp. WAC06614 TaxID=2487416 RepID=UPI000F78274C|nr:amino acid adenylation domain-containing protein [Streptomyces sp. WAC06614]RSS82225.1 amino acid adenylation domain-containing protein [Streptomyces sp. WAC06614]